MNKILNNLLLLSIIIFTNCQNKGIIKKSSIEEVQETKAQLISRVFSISEKQYSFLMGKIDSNNPLLQPRSIKNDGSIRLVSNKDWTCGFFPGSLWYLFEYTGDTKWKKSAEKYTEAIDSVQFRTTTHDLGFMVQNSYGNGLRLTGNAKYKQAVVDAAKSLSTRYRPIAKTIQSWSWDAGKGWQIPVIIDNMMNLNLLFKATEYSADTSFAHIANMHALTTLKNHYRRDNSCFHVVDYDKETGKVRNKMNYQGFSDSSSWARGQAWGLYGFTESYRNTNNKLFLEQAKNIAEYIMNSKKIPMDRVPYWDYDAPEIPNAPRDASAAAITASALFELATFVPERKEELTNYAIDIIKNLSTEKYLAKGGDNNGFILKHSVGNIHENNETNTAINYADYYFLEALIRWKNLK